MIADDIKKKKLDLHGHNQLQDDDFMDDKIFFDPSVVKYFETSGASFDQSVFFLFRISSFLYFSSFSLFVFYLVF